MIYFFKIFFKELLLSLRARRIGYYTHIDFLPVYNWFQIMDGKFEFIYKKQKTIKYPEFFKNIPLQMLFQFEKLDTEYFEKQHKLAYVKALYVTTKRIDFLNKYRTLKKEFENDNKFKTEKVGLNYMLNVIEEGNKAIGQIDVHKMSTSRFFSLYYRTIEKNKANANITA